MKYRLVLFDLDGTLTDTLEAISKVINESMKDMELRTYSLEESREYIGYGVQGLVERIFSKEGYDRNRVNPQRMLETIRENYKKYFNYNVKLYEDIDRLLDFLEKNGIRMGIVTNKDHEMALGTVEKNLSKWNFIEIIGADDERHPRKPHPYGIEYISDIHGIPKEKTLFVGDMAVDVETARNAGVDMIYCNWGFGKAKNETGIDESIRVDTVEELIRRIM